MASDTTLTELFSVLKRTDYTRECHKLLRNQGTNVHKKINNIRGTKCSGPWFKEAGQKLIKDLKNIRPAL